MKPVCSIFFIIFAYSPALLATNLSTRDLQKIATDELNVHASSDQKSQTVKISTETLKPQKKTPSSFWSFGFQQLSFKPTTFTIDSVTLTTPKINKTNMLYFSASTPVVKLINNYNLNLFGSLSYGRSKTEFQSISKFQDGQIEAYQPTIGFSFKFYQYKNLNFKIESGYALYLYNIKTNNSKYKQNYSSQSLQNSINLFWKSFSNSGLELSLSKESLLNGEFEPTYSLRAGYRGQF